ncbi:MAG: bifunctional methylenetetrahydrofolate dehydrogenase/methenyltetrahydrofolate cyclohydrolase FolD [Bacteroidales bacterium]|nr:bifunctional methylenetetrahydrofolate dehydrogenase/methenyltetrahydrofolate cyclohydrolase FolD [Bacteroidales bacterium]
MELLNGKILSDIVKDELKTIVANMKNCGQTVRLAVIQVGSDSASSVYVNNKKKSCEYIGINSDIYHLHELIDQDILINMIENLNEDKSVNGILVQLPLPRHLNENEILSKIHPSKDVDGFHEYNVGNLVLGNNGIVSCTPSGIMKILQHYNIDVAGKECVVVGRSNIVGKPMALLLLRNDGTVTVCHSKTKNLKEICKRADILVCAIGKPKFFNKDYIKDGAVVIDVGIHRQENGKLCGDVDFEDVKDIVSAITPVPNGVGSMTVAMLMDNCVKAAQNQYEK